MANHNLENIENVIINTGNILSINDITKKPNPNPTEEVNISIAACFSFFFLKINTYFVLLRCTKNILTCIKNVLKYFSVSGGNKYYHKRLSKW